jgi:hypothetical protein
MTFKVGNKVRCTLHYNGADHEHDYEILAIGGVNPRRPDLGRPWTVRQLDSGEVFGMAHLERRNPRLLGSEA